jgi:ABC-type phosphate transport system substrate-binding protein
MHPRWLTVIIVLVLGLSSTARAEDPEFKIIVNPKNPIASIDRTLLRNAFLKKESLWKGGETIRPVGVSSKFSARDRFVRSVLKKTPAQLKTYWTQQIFSGKGVPPPEADSAADVVRYVLAHPGAIGFVPADVDSRTAKVVEVK